MNRQRQIEEAGCPRRAGILLAATIVIAVVVVQCLPGLPEFLQWSRKAEETSRLHAWLTCHVTHWTWNHLVWDLLAFVMLSVTCLRLMPERYAWCLLVSAALIPWEIRLNQPAFVTYRGLSGIDSGLAGLAVAGLWMKSSACPVPGRSRLVALLAGGGFLAKALFEMETGVTVFVADAGRTFEPVVSAHLTGFLSGLGAGLLWTRRATGEFCLASATVRG